MPETVVTAGRDSGVVLAVECALSPLWPNRVESRSLERPLIGAKEELGGGAAFTAVKPPPGLTGVNPDEPARAGGSVLGRESSVAFRAAEARSVGDEFPIAFGVFCMERAGVAAGEGV